MMRRENTFEGPARLLRREPNAEAHVAGSPQHPGISGTVCFYQTPNGVLVAVEAKGLPHEPGQCGGRFYGFHIHGGGECSGSAEDPFAAAGEHFNPGGCPHPEHAGDLPPLLGNSGYALMSVLTDRFRVSDVIGRTVIIHDRPDDFHSQPSGDSGTKIACGRIARAR